MYTAIALAILVIVLFLAWSWRRGSSPAKHEPTRAGSPRTPRAELRTESAPVDSEENAS